MYRLLTSYGMFGTPLFNRLYSEFVYTWPVCLFAIHQVTLTAIVRASRQPTDRRAKWTSSTATLVLLLVCLFYYLLCRDLGLTVAWVFLMGFIPSWPVALPPQLLRPTRRARPHRCITARSMWL